MLEDLQARAVDAATAQRLETIASDAQYADAQREELYERAAAILTAVLDDDDAASAATYELADNGHVVIEIAGIKLEAPRAGGFPVALITCPQCDAWDQHSADYITDLADFGELLVGPVKLDQHRAPETGYLCDGLRMTPPPDERESWRVDTAASAEQLYKKLNLAATEGYAPAIFPSATEGYVIVGKRIGSRFNMHLDAFDEDGTPL